MPCVDFEKWGETELAKIQITRLFESCINERGGFTILPSQRVCPDADINFRYAFDEVVRKIGIEEINKRTKQKRDQDAWRNNPNKFQNPTASPKINQGTWGGAR